MSRSRTAPVQSSDPPAILMATADTLPQPYEVLGLVYVTMAVTAGIVPTGGLMDKLAGEAIALGADAVIGVRLSQLALPVASRARLLSRATEHHQNTAVAVALGTAVRQLATATIRDGQP
jgi:hypothetical protein